MIDYHLLQFEAYSCLNRSYKAPAEENVRLSKQTKLFHKIRLINI